MSEIIHPALEIDTLSVWLKESGKVLPAVSRVSLAVGSGGCTGVIGESGCGKSLTCRAALGLLDQRKWTIEGAVRFQEVPLPLENDRVMDSYRGRQMALVTQNPMQAFDPRQTIAGHFLEGCPWRERKERRREAARLLERLYIRDPEAVLKSYSFQLSGGMLQRILIALAVSLHPRLLVADEPTTALDSTNQYETIQIFRQLQREDGLSILLVSHDLEVISQMADTVYVMYAGIIVEYGKKEDVLRHPLHPYTQALFRSRPAFSKQRLDALPGRPPGLGKLARGGCPFADRCPLASEKCRQELMPLRECAPAHWSRCQKKEGA